MQLNVLIRLIFTKAEHYLLKNQRQFVLEENQDSDKNEERVTDIDVLQTNSKYFQKLLEGTMLKQIQI